MTETLAYLKHVSLDLLSTVFIWWML